MVLCLGSDDHQLSPRKTGTTIAYDNGTASFVHALCSPSGRDDSGGPTAEHVVWGCCPGRASRFSWRDCRAHSLTCCPDKGSTRQVVRLPRTQLRVLSGQRRDEAAKPIVEDVRKYFFGTAVCVCGRPPLSTQGHARHAFSIVYTYHINTRTKNEEV